MLKTLISLTVMLLPPFPTGKMSVPMQIFSPLISLTVMLLPPYSTGKMSVPMSSSSDVKEPYTTDNTCILVDKVVSYKNVSDLTTLH